MSHVMALDLGTTGTRSVIFDDRGQVAGQEYREWNSIFPSPAEVEQDASTWWLATRETINAVLKTSRVAPADIAAVAITNQRETIVPVDGDGKPLANAIVWQDRRTGTECDALRSSIGREAIYKTTGLTIDPYFSATKILWFKHHRPAIYEQASKFLLVHDFILHELTGRFATDHSNASRTMLFDINTLRWSDDLAGRIGIDLDKMPEAVPSGTIAGTVLPSTGCDLAPGTTVVAGAGDQQCAALGVGVTAPGRVKCTMGTGTFLVAHASGVSLDPGMRALCSCAAVPGKHVVEASMFSTGSLLRWARDTLGHAECQEAERDDVSPYQVIDRKAAISPLGANGLLFLPFIVGAGAPYWNPDARGTILGLAAGHSRGDVYRAIMESTSFDVAKNLAVFREMGLSSAELRLTGGGSKSGIWNQILCDACGIPCLVPSFPESTAMGAALLASTGAGFFSDLSKAADEFISIKTRVEPEPSRHAAYQKIIAAYDKLYATLDASGMFKDIQAMIAP